MYPTKFMNAVLERAKMGLRLHVKAKNLQIFGYEESNDPELANGGN